MARPLIRNIKPSLLRQARSTTYDCVRRRSHPARPTHRRPALRSTARGGSRPRMGRNSRPRETAIRRSARTLIRSVVQLLLGATGRQTRCLLTHAPGFSLPRSVAATGQTRERSCPAATEPPGRPAPPPLSRYRPSAVGSIMSCQFGREPPSIDGRVPGSDPHRTRRPDPPDVGRAGGVLSGSTAVALAPANGGFS